MSLLLAHPSGGRAHTPGMCPDWESKERPFGLKANAQSTELHQPEENKILYTLVEVLRWRSSFLNHHGIHTGESPYEGNECGNIYSSSSVLRRLWRIHTGERPYECKKCGKSFARSFTLRCHQRVHLGE